MMEASRCQASLSSHMFHDNLKPLGFNALEENILYIIHVFYTGFPQPWKIPFLNCCVNMQKLFCRR